jgi:hypothetical protein
MHVIINCSVQIIGNQVHFERNALVTATTLMLATSATAGSFSFSLPNLSFPPTADVTASKDCVAPAETTGLCIVKE